VRDAALLLDALVGYDPDDPFTATAAGSPNVSNDTDRLSLGDLHGVLGVLRQVFGDAAADPRGRAVNVTVERPIGELSRRATEVIGPLVMPGFAALNEGTTSISRARTPT
jgi:amidase